MKTSLNLRLLALILFISQNVLSQTLIATSNNSWATARSNQRKIVRDYEENSYIIYTDLIADTVRIFGLVYSNENNSWTTATQITTGQSPTLAIGIDDRIHMVYEINDYPDHRIMYLHTDDFLSWSDPVELSNTQYNCRYPVADVDSLGILNILWIEDGPSYQDYLIYCSVSSDSISEPNQILSREELMEVSIANHLQYYKNDMFFGISCFSNFSETVQFFRSSDYLESFDTVHEANGWAPCISFNSEYEEDPEYALVRYLYVNENANMIEVEGGGSNYIGLYPHQLSYGTVTFLSIDNVAPPIGYSFLFMQNEQLKHGFSYGGYGGWSSVMSVYQGNYDIIHPSIAYKHFNPLYVDFIWMEEVGLEEYNIYYKREDKHVWMPGIEDNEDGKGFSVIGNPNPFKDQIVINVLVEEEKLTPSLKIYSVSSQMIKELSFTKEGDRSFKFIWNGIQADGNYAEEGIYIVLCSVGDNRTARKIIYQP